MRLRAGHSIETCVRRLPWASGVGDSASWAFDRAITALRRQHKFGVRGHRQQLGLARAFQAIDIVECLAEAGPTESRQ